MLLAADFPKAKLAGEGKFFVNILMRDWKGKVLFSFFLFSVISLLIMIRYPHWGRISSFCLPEKYHCHFTISNNLMYFTLLCSFYFVYLTLSEILWYFLFWKRVCFQKAILRETYKRDILASAKYTSYGILHFGFCCFRRWYSLHCGVESFCTFQS